MQVQRTILIIDDDALIRESYRDILEADRLSVVETSNGAEALTWLRWETSELIILDLEMPVLDGRGFLEYRLQHAPLRTIPVLVVSSRLDDPGLGQVLRRLGADRLFQKPVSRKDILGAVRELLARPRMPDVPPPMEAPEGVRRKDARLVFTIPLRIRTRSFLVTSGCLRDLSAGGLGAYLPRRLPDEETVTIRLDIQGRSLALTGFVQWAGDSPTASGYRYGIRFADRQEDSFPLHAYSYFRGHAEAPNWGRTN